MARWRPWLGWACSFWPAGLALWLTGHMLAVWGTRLDPQFLPVFARHLRFPPLLDV